AMPICLRLFVHCARRADSRADWTAGNSSATRTPMMAITTSSSTRVKAGLGRDNMRESFEETRVGGQETGTTAISLLGGDVEVEFEGAFFLDVDLVLTFAVPFGRDLWLGLRRQVVAGHV